MFLNCPSSPNLACDHCFLTLKSPLKSYNFPLYLISMATLTFTPISPASYLPLSHGKLPSFNPIQCLGSPKDAIQISSNGHATTFPEKYLLTRPVTSSPSPRPRRIILLRHGQCEGNVDESVYTRVADPKVVLTEKGKTEAEECGWRIREMIEKDGAADWKVYFYVSPYKRTLETLQHLGRAFERSRIAGMREEPRIREQDFGRLLSSLFSDSL